MFRSSKKEKKEKNTCGNTSSYHETTTVQKTNNGTTIIRQVSSESTHTRAFTSENRSLQISHSSSAGTFSSLLPTDRPLSLASSSSGRLFGSNSSFPALQNDASPFTPSTALSRTSALPASNATNTALPRTSLNDPYNRFGTSYQSPFSINNTINNTRSFPLRSREPVLATIANQNAAQNQNIAQSVPATIVPTYFHKSSKLGKMLIINNIKFIDNRDEREGSKKDAEDLKKLFKKLGFEVETKDNLKGKEMSKKVKEFSKSSFSSHDMSVVVIMSHGNNLVVNGENAIPVRGGFTQIAGTDNELVLTEEFIEHFTGANCHASLKGKAKVFIFQCCRGKQDLLVCHDAGPIKAPQKQYSDVLVAHSTLPGYLSNRNPKTGTWYIQSLCEVFERHHKDYHLEDMLKIVDDELSRKHPRYTQTSTYESRGFKRCYLYKNSR